MNQKCHSLKVFLIIILLGFVANSFSQENKNNTVTMDNNLIIKVIAQNIKSLNSDYEIDISNLDFQNKEKLEKFCNLFSTNLYSFNGDFEKKSIHLTLNKNVIEEKKLSLSELNENFKSLSQRMLFIYRK